MLQAVTDLKISALRLLRSSAVVGVLGLGWSAVCAADAETFHTFTASELAKAKSQPGDVFPELDRLTLLNKPAWWRKRYVPRLAVPSVEQRRVILQRVEVKPDYLTPAELRNAARGWYQATEARRRAVERMEAAIESASK